MKNRLLKNNFEKVFNYLLQNDFKKIKIIYIIKEKHVNTVTAEKIKRNTIYEEGFSVNFNYNNQPYFIALDNYDYNIIKKRIDELVKIEKRNRINECFHINEDFFEVKEREFDTFDDDKYQNELIEFNNKKDLKTNIILLFERKKTFILSQEKNVYKEELNYKIDIIMNAVINNNSKFNYASFASSNSIKRLRRINIENELSRLYSTIMKMKSLNHINEKRDVVISNGIGGIIIHESCGHALESREIIKKSSILNDITNVNNLNINMTDNPTIRDEFGSFNIDDEGNCSNTIKLIDKGNIKNYLCDEKGSCFNNDAGSGRRESYYYPISSRMSNTYLESGNNSFNDIISSIEDGFYIKNILGGVVDTISGNFSFNCLESYKIVHGIIDYSICYDNLTIVGNTLDILNNIEKVGNDLSLSPGICGSESGFIYTTVGGPTIKIKDILVVS